MRDGAVDVQPIEHVLRAHAPDVPTRAGAFLTPGTPAEETDRTTEEDAMPESFGKRKRRDVTAKKAAAREERRVARAARRRDREAGLIEAGTPIGPAEQSEWLPASNASAEAEEEHQAEG
jgi:hypothetical protein